MLLTCSSTPDSSSFSSEEPETCPSISLERSGSDLVNLDTFLPDLGVPNESLPKIFLRLCP